MNRKTIEEISQEIGRAHNQIIEDWCKAYISHLYQEDGKMPNPGDFILEQREVKEPNWAGYEYRFRRKSEGEGK